VFYINPSRRGPVPLFLGFLAGAAGRALLGPFLGVFPNFGEIGVFRPRRGLGTGAPGETPGRVQGPGARG